MFVAMHSIVRSCLLPCNLGCSEVVDVCCHALLDVVRSCVCCHALLDVVRSCVCCHGLLDVVRWSMFVAMHSWM